MPADFQKAYERMAKYEGVISNDPADPGGFTKYGISLRWYRQAVNPKATEADIAALTQGEAMNLWRTYWWAPYGYEELPQQVAEKIFLHAVNMGVTKTIECAQRALWASTGEHIEDDGALGPITRKLLTKVENGAWLAAMRSEVAAHYRVLTERNPILAKFKNGWLNRAYDR